MSEHTTTNKRAEGKPEYTLEDCGCYVDSARGVYAIDKIVRFVESHGSVKMAEANEYNALGSLSECEFVDEIEDNCDAFMNDYFAPDGAYWGRNENGDWGLWAMDQD